MDAALSIGSTFGQYMLVGRLGSGGMAELFLAERKAAAGVSKRVAIKVILPHLGRDPGYVEMFLDEARLAARLEHPNIVQVFDFGEIEGRYYLAMEYLAGVTLSDVVRRLREDERPMPVEVALEIGIGICRGLHYAHELTADGRNLGIVHRDVTPSNVMIGMSGAVKLLDFGIARSHERMQERTQTGIVKGKLSYCAPEQLGDTPQDRRVDVWAVGVILHELLSGARLFKRDTEPRTIQAVLNDPIPALDERAGVPESLGELVARCLRRDPGERPDTALEVRRALEAVPTGGRTPLDDFMGELFPDGVDFPSTEVPTVVADPQRDGANIDHSADGEVSDTRGPDPATVITKSGATRPEPERRRRWGIIAAALGVVTALAITLAWIGAAGGRLDEIEQMIQRGEHERGRMALDEYLDDHPDDGEALLMRAFVQWWVQAPRIDEAVSRARKGDLDEVEAAALEGLVLVNAGRNAEADKFLEGVLATHPDRPELLYVAGEAKWHRDALEEGAQTLLDVVRADPGWLMALHHPTQYFLDQRRPEVLEPIIDLLRPRDPIKAAELDAVILIHRQRYDEATRLLDSNLEEHAGEATLWARLTESLTLAEDWRRAKGAAGRAAETWPLDNRESGGTALYAEQLLYRGDLLEYRQTVSPTSRMLTLVEAIWRDVAYGDVPRPPMVGMRNPPLHASAYLVNGFVMDRDDADVYSGYPEPDVAALGKGLAAERTGDLTAATVAYEAGLAAPQTGEIRMLLAHALGRARRGAGDVAGAAAACDEVLVPRVYFPYRAILWPDCMLWTGEAEASDDEAREYYRRLSETFRGEFQHPAVVEARRHLRDGDTP